MAVAHRENRLHMERQKARFESVKETLKMEANVTYWQSVLHWGVEGELAESRDLEE